MLKLAKKNNFTLIFWVFFYFLIFSLLLRNSFSYLDPDLGWHLKVGEEIASTFKIPHLNNYNYTFNGNWVDHEWLINLISYEIYDNLGYFALNVFFVLIIILSLILLNIIVRRFFKKIPEALIALLQLFGALASLPQFGIRMQEFSFLFLILEIWIIEEFTVKKTFKPLIFLTPLFYLWANIHGSFLFGLSLLFIWPLVKIIERSFLLNVFKKYFSFERIIENKYLLIFLLFSFFSLGATLITPYGLELYSFLSGYSNTFYLKAIQEWLPQSVFPFNYTQISYLSLVTAILIIYLYNLRRNFASSEKINIWQLGLSLLMMVAAFKSRRNFPLMFAVTFLFLISPLVSSLDLEKIKIPNLRKELKYFLLLAMFLSGVMNLLNFKTFKDPFSNFCSKYPCGAVDFLKNQEEYKNYNILNEYDWGGYLIWTYPEKKLFIDGRLPQVQYKDKTLMEEYFEFTKKNSNFESKLNEYDINLVLVNTQDYKIKAHNWERFLFWLNDDDLISPSYLRDYLESSGDWENVYRDSVASVYIRKNKN